MSSISSRTLGPPSGSVPRPATLILDNQQRLRRLDARRLRQVIEADLADLPDGYELALHWVSSRQMTRLNRRYLRHEGSTDVITFDHGSTRDSLRGELFVSVEDAVVQARAFRTPWPEEIVRYVIHGFLHLRGFDDLDVRSRRKMKREENRRLSTLIRHFRFARLGRATRVKRPARAETRPSR